MFSLEKEMYQFLCRLSIFPEAKQVMLDSVEACSKTCNPEEFEFLMTKFDFFEEFNRSITIHINEQSDFKSAHDIYRSELWRKAVISATDVKHSDPMSFADKVLSHYDEKFNIK